MFSWSTTVRFRPCLHMQWFSMFFKRYFLDIFCRFDYFWFSPRQLAKLLFYPRQLAKLLFSPRQRVKLLFSPRQRVKLLFSLVHEGWLYTQSVVMILYFMGGISCILVNFLTSPNLHLRSYSPHSECQNLIFCTGSCCCCEHRWILRKWLFKYSLIKKRSVLAVSCSQRLLVPVKKSAVLIRLTYKTNV